MDKIDEIGLSKSQLNDGVINLLNKHEFTTKDFLGVYSIDLVDDMISDCNVCVNNNNCFFWLIYNNKPSFEPGEHWRVILFYRNRNKWHIYIYDSLGGGSLLSSYPIIFGNIINIKRRDNLTINYNNQHNDSFINFKDKLSKNICKTIDNKSVSNEEREFNNILKHIYNKSNKSKVKVGTLLNRIQKQNTGTCGLYCLLYIDVGIIPFYNKTNSFIRNNFDKLLRDHSHFTGKILGSQSHIKVIKKTKTAEENENNIKGIYGRYIS